MPNVSAGKTDGDRQGPAGRRPARRRRRPRSIARYNIGANLVGHDSHGIILIPTYIDRIKVGHIVPRRAVGDHAGDRRPHGDRWQLGFWLRRDRPRDALHDREGEEAEGRRGDGVSAEPYRTAWRAIR